MKKSVIATALFITCIVTPAAWATCPYPSRFGPTDEIGASQTQTPRKLLQAIKLIETGKVFKLAHDYNEPNVWLIFGRTFDVNAFPLVFGPQVFFVAQLEATIGQVGTQFDALAHAGLPDEDGGFYNCIPSTDLGPDSDGLLKKLGTETVRPFFTRAVLYDFVNNFEIPGIKEKGERLPEHYIITKANLRSVLKAQGTKRLKEGDVALIYTGWEEVYGNGTDDMCESAGLGVEASEWLAGRKIAMVGSDNFSIGATMGCGEIDTIPSGPGAGGPVASHFIFITKNGIHLLENMKLSGLAAASLAAGSKPKHLRRRRRRNPYEYAFVYTVLPITGIAGAPGQPIAIE